VSYYDAEGIRHAMWPYRVPFDELAVIADLVSFEPTRWGSHRTGNASRPRLAAAAAGSR